MQLLQAQKKTVQRWLRKELVGISPQSLYQGFASSPIWRFPSLVHTHILTRHVMLMTLLVAMWVASLKQYAADHIMQYAFSWDIAKKVVQQTVNSNFR